MMLPAASPLMPPPLRRFLDFLNGADCFCGSGSRRLLIRSVSSERSKSRVNAFIVGVSIELFLLIDGDIVETLFRQCFVRYQSLIRRRWTNAPRTRGYVRAVRWP